MENIKQMRQRHQKEIIDLQTMCKHPNISDWIDYMWAPGHISEKVRVCKFCGEIIATENDIDSCNIVTSSNSSKKRFEKHVKELL